MKYAYSEFPKFVEELFLKQQRHIKLYELNIIRN